MKADILSLKNEVENNRRKLILEKEIQEKQKNQILNTIFENENAKINEELGQYESKISVLKENIEYYKMRISESVYSHDNSQDFENYKKLLESQYLEISKLKSEMNIIESKLSKMGYPQFSNKIELANMESELRHREIEINSYLREKEQIRNSVDSFKQSFKGELSPTISSISPASPNKFPYQYLSSSSIPSATFENVYGSYLNLPTLERNFNEKSEELKNLRIIK